MNRLPKRKSVASRTIDGQAVVIQTKLAEVSMLNDVGSTIWAAIDGVTGESEIAQRLTEEFEVEPQQARADVAAFLDELAAAELVEFS